MTDQEIHNQEFDMIVVGAGIYGIMTALEAGRRGLKALVLDRADINGGTSLNHLRTVHGGLRYLQSMDLPRFFESVGERRWFLRHMPRRITPLPCLLPLYSKGLQRNSIMRCALLLNDVLSWRRNRQVPRDRHLHRGRVLSRRETLRRAPGVDSQGLKGSALWFDGGIMDYQRVFIELAQVARSLGAVFRPYREVTGLVLEEGRVVGVDAMDTDQKQPYRYLAPLVINTAGPWTRELARRFDRDYPDLMPKTLVLWNVLFDQPALSDHALGLSVGKGKGHTYFFHPWKGRLLVGTGEWLLDGASPQAPRIPETIMDGFIADINRMVPSLSLSRQNIHRVFAGYLPATPQGKLANRPVHIDHGAQGGPSGFHSLTGVKFTTARRVCHHMLRGLFPHLSPKPYTEVFRALKSMDLPHGNVPLDGEALNALRALLAREPVEHLSDFVLRRTTLGDFPHLLGDHLLRLRPLFPDWDEEAWDREKKRLWKELADTGWNGHTGDQA